MMQRFFDLLVQFIQQGIVAIFRFVQFVWIWSVGQIATLLEAPWHEWSFAKRGALVGILIAVGYVLYWVYRDLWAAGQSIMSAFGTLLSVLVRTLPRVLIAGLIALGGVWVLNNVDFSRIRMPEYRLDNANGR